MDEIFKKADEYIKRVLSLIKKGTDLFPKTYNSSKKLYNEGYVQYNGIIVPLNTISHRILLDHYEKIFLQAYKNLLESLWEERTSLTNEFAFRAMLEMGIENSFLIFDKKVEKDDKKIYLLILLLADYASIETNMSGYFYNWFKNLLNDNNIFLKEKLTEKEWQIIVNLKDTLGDNVDKQKYRKAVERTRRLVNSIKNKIIQKYSKKGDYIENENIRAIKSGESHTLHGNVFLIIDRLNKKSANNHLFRIYSYTFISSTHLLKRLSDYLENKKYKEEVSNFITEYDFLSKQIAKAWASLSIKTGPIISDII